MDDFYDDDERRLTVEAQTRDRVLEFLIRFFRILANGLRRSDFHPDVDTGHAHAYIVLRVLERLTEVPKFYEFIHIVAECWKPVESFPTPFGLAPLPRLKVEISGSWLCVKCVTVLDRSEAPKDGSLLPVSELEKLVGKTRRVYFTMNFAAPDVYSEDGDGYVHFWIQSKEAEDIERTALLGCKPYEEIWDDHPIGVCECCDGSVPAPCARCKAVSMRDTCTLERAIYNALHEGEEHE